MGFALQLQTELIKGIADEIEMTLRWNQFAKTTLQQERKFKPVLRNVFTKQEADVLKRVRENPPPEQKVRIYTSRLTFFEGNAHLDAGAEVFPQMVLKQTPSEIYKSWLFEPEEWAFFLEEAAKPFIETAMEEGASDSMKQIGNALDVTIGLDLNVNDPNVQKIIQDKLHVFSFEVNKETTRLLKAEFTEAIKDGDSIRVIEKRVKKVFGFTKKSRVNTIARTEIGGAYGSGNWAAMVDSGVVETKKWIATRDNRTRESHVSIDGEVVPLKEKFSNGLRFPKDWTGALAEFINCRCTMMAQDFVI